MVERPVWRLAYRAADRRLAIARGDEARRLYSASNMSQEGPNGWAQGVGTLSHSVENPCTGGPFQMNLPQLTAG